jgi:hypothetical protein
MNAQDVYRQILREIAPRLREAGLTGSLTQYRLDENGGFGHLDFQSWMGKDREFKRFTLNLWTVTRGEWAAAQSRRADSAASLAPRFLVSGCWYERIGKVMPACRDVWWSVRPDTDPIDVADAVTAAICDFAIPAVRSHLWAPDSHLWPPDSHPGASVEDRSRHRAARSLPALVASIRSRCGRRYRRP